MTLIVLQIEITMNGVLFADNQHSLQPCPINRARPLLPGLLIAKKPNAGDERAAERRHRQSEGTDAYLQEG